MKKKKIDTSYIRRRITGPASIKVFIKEHFNQKLLQVFDLLYWKGYYFKLSYWEKYDVILNKITITTPALDVYINDKLECSIFLNFNETKFKCYAHRNYIVELETADEVLEVIERGF